MIAQYRTATIDDLPQIVAIYNSTIACRMVTADTEPVSLSSRMTWFTSHDPKDRPLWVVPRGNQIAAWLSFSDFYGRPAYKKSSEISIYVHEEFRHQGLGSYLLEEALRAAPSLKISTVLGFIFGHNQPSLTLFQRFGFEQWGLLPKVALLNGVERDLVIVGKHLA
jgi:L-amino acid N-acyltransferase YncA